MPLPDVLSAVGRKTGRFTLWNTSTQHYYELHIDQGLLTGLIVDNEPVEDVFPLRNRMVELMNLTSGEFEFENLASRLLHAHHQLAIDTLLLSGLSVLNEVKANRSQLPNAQTVFRTKISKEPWLTGDLLEFWNCSGPMLSEGASADVIAKSTSLYLDQVLLCLYKLRMAGIISPARAFQYDLAGASAHSVISKDFTFMPKNLDFEHHFGRAALASAGGPTENGQSKQEMGIVQRIMFRLRKGFARHS